MIVGVIDMVVNLGTPVVMGVESIVVMLVGAPVDMVV